MKKTWKEIQVSKCIKIGNQYKYLKPLMLVCIILIVIVSRTGKYFITNQKRMVGVGISFVLFIVSNSFSLPSFQGYYPEDLVEATEIESALDEGKSGYSEYDEDFFSEEGQVEQHMEGSEVAQSQYSVDEILKNNSSHKVESNEEPGNEKGFSKEDWNLILVNKQHPIPQDYSFELGTIAGNMKCDARILPELFSMLQDAKDAGVNLAVCSPYRDISRQQKLFNRKIQLHMGNGYSYMEAYKKASQIVTVPGASEHQIGLALDIISDNYTSLDEGFGETEAGKWLKEHSKKYGFILRYPQGKEYITGIDYEPWHFRYVGKEAATIIMENEITLEEFVESISE